MMERRSGKVGVCETEFLEVRTVVEEVAEKVGVGVI